MKNRIKNTPSQVRRKHMGQVTKLQDLKTKIDGCESNIKSTDSDIEKCTMTLNKLCTNLEKFIEENAEFEIPQTQAAKSSVEEELLKLKQERNRTVAALDIFKMQVTNCKLVITVPTAKFKKCFALKGINVPLM